MTLKELDIGKTAVITAVGGEGSLRQHFLDMGVIPGEEVTLVKYAPMGDPMELMIHGYELTLRLDDAAKIDIDVSLVKEKEKSVDKKALRVKKPHPGLGESGKYHEKEGEDPLPEGTLLTFALAGNQNCGKTTLFNQLTGSNRKFPGSHGRQEKRRYKGTSRHPCNRPAGYIFPFSLQQRGNSIPSVYNKRKAQRHHKHSGCH